MVLDLFGRDPLPPQPEPVTLACEECGTIFAQRQGQGRPWRYCSKVCRRTAKSRMARAWEKEALPKPSAISCRRCGLSLQAEGRKAGRLPQYCSAKCRRDFAKHGPDTSKQFPLPLDGRGEVQSPEP